LEKAGLLNVYQKESISFGLCLLKDSARTNKRKIQISG